MKLLITSLFLALFIYISLNSFLICVLAYSIYIISTSPKLPSPKLSLDFWMQTEKFFGRDAFYSLSYALYTQDINLFDILQSDPDQLSTDPVSVLKYYYLCELMNYPDILPVSLNLTS